jgi:hypothetical protein
MPVSPSDLQQTTMTEITDLQNNVLRTITNFSTRTRVRGLQLTYNIPYVYDLAAILCRQHTA